MILAHGESNNLQMLSLRLIYNLFFFLLALSKYHNRKIVSCEVACNRNLHGSNCAIATLGIELNTEPEMRYEPGDHVGVLACNNERLVKGILDHLDLAGLDPDRPLELQHLKETQTSTGDWNKLMTRGLVRVLAKVQSLNLMRMMLDSLSFATSRPYLQMIGIFRVL